MPEQNKSFPDINDERWVKISFEGISTRDEYQISDYGRIRILKRNNDWKILKTANVGGYPYFSFKSDVSWKVRKTKSVHRLVAEKFCRKNGEDKKFVIHLDYNKGNNHYKNLKWVDQKELTAHNKLNPNVINAVRKNVITNHKLTETDVVRLKLKLQRGNTKLYKLAKEFGITHTQLNRIRKGENWAHVKVPEKV